jgi:hypothetical protein
MTLRRRLAAYLIDVAIWIGGHARPSQQSDSNEDRGEPDETGDEFLDALVGSVAQVFDRVEASPVQALVVLHTSHECATFWIARDGRYDYERGLEAAISTARTMRSRQRTEPRKVLH